MTDSGEGRGKERRLSLFSFRNTWNRESGRFTKEENKSNICKHVYV